MLPFLVIHVGTVKIVTTKINSTNNLVELHNHHPLHKSPIVVHRQNVTENEWCICVLSAVESRQESWKLY